MREGSNHRRQFGFIIFVFLTALLAGPAIAAPPLTTPNAITQPAGQNSVLIPFGYNGAAGFKEPNVIYDDTLAKWAQSALTVTNPVTKAVTPIAGSASFMFQQCFGGGFLDDLNTTLTPSGLPWVGGSAAQFDQPAYGQAKGVPAAGAGGDSPVGTPPVNYWTSTLNPVLLGGTNLATDIDTANALDPLGTPLNPAPKISETGQLYYANGGGTISLDNNNTTEHYAILFAGLTDAQRHFTSINTIYTDLVNAWAGTPYTITVLYGNGINQVLYNNAEKNLALLPFIGNANTNVLSATYANLQNAFANDGTAILNDFQNGKTNDQFFFYAGDHGGNNQVFGGGVGGGGPAGTMTTTLPSFSMSPSTMDALSEDNIDTPSLSFDYTDPGSDVEVLLNGHAIGEITAGTSTATFDVPDADFLAGTDSIALDTIDGPAFTISDYSLFTGAVDDGSVSAPEPASALLLALAMPLALQRRRLAV